MKKRVVVTGIGLVSPLGDDPEVAWKRLIEGESGITELEDPELQDFRSKIAGQCKDFSPSQYVERKDEKKIERFAQFSYVSGIRAVEQSGIDFSKEDPFRCAVIVGCGAGGLAEIARQDAKLSAGGPSRVSPLTIPKIIINSASSLLAVRFGIHGVSYGVATACASANNAMIEAYKLIRDGDADVALTGGTEAAVCKLGLAGFSAMRALSGRNETPEKASRPFDAYRDGFVLGEGAGMVVLEELEHAKKRGAAILGEFAGYGVTTDAHHITQPDPEGVYAGAAMQAALRTAQIAPERLDYINAHGTATHLGDAAEVTAIKRLFGDAAKSVSISSTKSAIGHLLGGSGGVELIFSLMAIRDGVIPPTLNLEYPDEGFDLDFTPLVAKERKVDWAMSNSFGFGGHNACVVVARFVD
ncbi:MAG: beta-ketoacyl-ACP synthase II [Thermoguttaceae bacterium]|nr:beta-ketoacyl-ACP synthase II [Thermoguttaceae bacterium]MBQ3821776.1 beta-ketoacyl-ACP synthase II [Thermoguttaceae bacterium]MBQ4195469.1 beta-ketoacyl-ACP synthase II [Thermoguttaceae bacterium]MBQ5366318.1 beta-ketoacyl-ACP synthase II [Thermoguttaceae bacterium]